MPDISATEIPKPLNWQDFQRSSRVLFRGILRDDSIQEFGRDGQTQHGIDLFGYRNGDTSLPVGVQCRRYKSPLSEAKMRADVDEAREIKPALTEFIFATTSDRDKNMQLAAAKLTAELKKSGWECRVTVMAWQDLQHDIALHPEALRAFSPTMAVVKEPIIAAVKASEESVTAKLDEHTSLLIQMNERLSRAASAPADEYEAELAELPEDARNESRILHTKINEIRKLIGKGKTKTALESFRELEETELPPYAKHRVLANIGAIHFNAGRNKEALDYFGRALQLRPDEAKAQVNLAYAELVDGNVEGARARAKVVLEEHPDHAGAASLVIQSHQHDDGGKDPFSLVPKETHDAAEVQIAAIVALRTRDDVSWMDLARKAGERYPQDRHLSRFAAEAIIDPALSDRDVVFGKHIDQAVMKEVGRAAAKLRDLWSREMELEDVRSEEALPLANNAAAALRFSGDDEGAAQILDETIAKVARDPGLIRARALLHLHADENEKGAALLESIDDPEGTLFLAQLMALKEPARAKKALGKLKVEVLRPELRVVVPEVWGEIALAENDKAGIEKALKDLADQAAPFETLAILRARAIERGLLERPAETEDEEGDKTSPVVAHILEALPAEEPKLGFPARVQLAQFLERHDADEAASNLLHGRIDLDRDSVSLRTYLSASIGAQLFARAKDVLDALPPALLEIPAFSRMAASYHWNIGDARKAQPFIARLSQASPQRLDLLLWHIDALIRTNAEKRVREILEAPVETVVEGSFADKRRLVAALGSYGQLERARSFAYKLFALNRDEPGAWMSFMGMMLTGERPEKDPILDPKIGPDHAIELRLESGETRRYVIESDADVRRVSQDAITIDHEVAKRVQGLMPGDKFEWPTDGSSVEIIGSKHKLLDAFHMAIGRFNDRFPSAKGFRQVKVGTPDEFDTTEIEEMLRERSDYIASEAQKYEEGRISLSMLAHLCGLDPVDAAIGLSELSRPYRVSVGSQEERVGTIRQIRDHKAAGCIVEAATYHCIRRLGIEDTIRSVCGPIAITQATADIYHARVQSLDDLGGEPKGSMTMRGGKMQVVEYGPEYLANTRRVIEGDRDWLTANAEILPAIPKADPPLAMRRLAAVQGARFFDDVFAASGSSRLLVCDDLFTRQAGNVLGVVSTSLQPVLMVARERNVISSKDYARFISDLIDMGQTSIGVDAAALLAARELDIEAGAAGVGPRLIKITKALGGPYCDPASHCSVTADFIKSVWSDEPLEADDYAVISHVLSAVLRSRTQDYQGMLGVIDQHLDDHEPARVYLRQWARGHFLI